MLTPTAPEAGTPSAGADPLWELLIPPSRHGRHDRTAVEAAGTQILFADGVWRLCATSGLWNANLGYGNTVIADAVAEALRTASYLTLFRSGHTWAVAAARALLRVAGPDRFARVLFSTSGSAANDMVMKLARQYWALRRQFGRRVVVGLRGSYHGLTYGSHGLTGMALGQRYYGVDQSLIRHVDHVDDGAELADLLSREGDRVAAVVVEPVLGTGAAALSDRMIAELGRLRQEYGFLLVADEVATGFGRTGPYFASQRWTTAPDVLVASKGMTNGTCAAAAVLVSSEVWGAFARSDAALTHAETQAGTPPTCAAIVATIAEMDRLGALERGADTARHLDLLIADIVGHPLVTGDDGRGCFRALRLGRDGEALSDAEVALVGDEIRDAGALVSLGPSCVQLAPALVYRDEDAARLGAAVRAGLDRAADRLAGKRVVRA
ncbi:daptide-type RiPP biosynthesis aminotransferase [Micromonospora sp. HUAS YX12]|uniref:Daptide-type RiPP biosynthesis aminotransferase n=1 Tax=Micromonospora sp. HUAS YX12 TaxID=3156396 RepID=A0AAU7R611_9ACTN